MSRKHDNLGTLHVTSKNTNLGGLVVGSNRSGLSGSLLPRQMNEIPNRLDSNPSNINNTDMADLSRYWCHPRNLAETVDIHR